MHQTRRPRARDGQPVKGLTRHAGGEHAEDQQGDTFSVSPDPKRLEHTAPNNSKRTQHYRLLQPDRGL